MKLLKEFVDQFKFNPKRELFIGAERECHLLDLDNKIVPIISRVLKGLPSCNGQFGYELSSCQLEWRIGPCRNITHFAEELEKSEITLRQAEKRLSFKRSFKEVGPEDMPLDVYPDPAGRNKKITRDMPREVLSAACRVIATHIHIGMPNLETALQAYNRTIKTLDYLCKLGDHSDGERLKLYSIVAPNCLPPYYENWRAFYNEAVQENFVDNPRDCWTLIRISKHGTIEFRMFGSTEDFGEIIHWASFCHKICQ